MSEIGTDRVENTLIRLECNETQELDVRRNVGECGTIDEEDLLIKPTTYWKAGEVSHGNKWLKTPQKYKFDVRQMNNY